MHNSHGIFRRVAELSTDNSINHGDDTLTGTDLHQPLKFVTYGNPPDTNSGYTTADSGIPYDSNADSRWMSFNNTKCINEL